MRKNGFIWVLILGYCSYLFGDGGVRVGNTQNVFIIHQGFVLESLSGYGFINNTYSPVLNLASSNPASIIDYQKFSSGLSFQFDSSVDSAFLNFEHQRPNDGIPQSGGIVYPFNDFFFGIGFGQKYTSDLIVDVPITTVANPDGTGEYFEARFQNSVKYISPVVAYKLDDLFLNDDNFSFGIQTNFNFLQSKNSVWKTTGKFIDDEFNLKFGFRYEFISKFKHKWSFGLTYESRFRFSGFYGYNPEIRLIDLDSLNTGNNQVIGTIPARFPVSFMYPSKLTLGYLLRPSEKVGIFGDFIYNFWKDIYEKNENRIDVSGGFFLSTSKLISFSLSFFMTEAYAYNGLMGEVDNTFDAVFLSVGLIFHYSKFDVHLVLADSHWFSDFRRKQTISKMGIGFNL